MSLFDHTGTVANNTGSARGLGRVRGVSDDATCSRNDCRIVRLDQRLGLQQLRLPVHQGEAPIVLQLQPVLRLGRLGGHPDGLSHFSRAGV